MARLKEASSLLAALGSVLVAGEDLGGTFKIIGEAGVGAMHTFQATPNTVFIVDKTQKNALQIGGHSAWATAYDLRTNTYRAMDVPTNTFCAAGLVLGNGTVIHAGGGMASQFPMEGINTSIDGRKRVRLLDPCDDGKCEWADRPDLVMNSPRWYPTTEALEDGSAIIIGGSLDGGYVNPQDNPTYEYFPHRGADRNMKFLTDTYPLNLYPLVWLLPDSRLFVQANYKAINFDHVNNVEQALPDIPHSFRVYPASASNWLTPLTAENNYTHTVNFCGGVSLTSDELLAGKGTSGPAIDVLKVAADSSCTSITPLDPKPVWTDFDPLPEGRVMGSTIILPDLTILVINGARYGTAGYGDRGNATWMTAGASFAESPTLTPVIYDPKRPKGKRWSSEGLSASTIPRLYHSTAILLSDGSIFVSGSNPNSDVVPLADRYGTEYRVEKFYPPYFSASRRPQPTGLPDSLSYGGDPFTIELSKDDLFGDAKNIETIMVTFVRPGYSTHAINFSQRAIKLQWSHEVVDGGGVRLTVQQLPSPTIFAPGPALLHVVVAGIPSVGKYVMAGNGKIGKQTVRALVLPVPSVNVTTSGSSSSGDSGSNRPSVSNPSDGSSSSGGSSSSSSSSSSSGSSNDKKSAAVSTRSISSSAALAAVTFLALAGFTLL